MLNYLYTLSDFQLLIALSAVLVILSVICVSLLHRVFPLKLKYRGNPVIGNISSLIGIIYGVLVGLMALYLINNVSATDEIVQREANAVANLYRDSLGMAMPYQQIIQTNLKKYIHHSIEVEWPAMQDNKPIDNESNQLIQNVVDTLLLYTKIMPSNEMLLLRSMFDEAKELYNAHAQRIRKSETSLNIEVWLVILIGTLLTISINYLYKIEYRLHLVTLCATSLMASAMLFLIVTLDRPFQGEFAIRSTPFKSILMSIDNVQKRGGMKGG